MEKKDFYLSNKEIKQKLQDATAGSWNKLALSSVIALLISLILPLIAFILAQFFDWYVVLIVVILALIIYSLMMYGYDAFMLKFSNSTNCNLSLLFSGFSKVFFKVIFLNIIQIIVVLCGYVLLIIPGVLLQIKFSMSMFCLLDNPKLSVFGAMKESSKLMKDNYGRLVSHFFSNFHWTTMFGLFVDIWLLPRYLVSKAIFYEDLKTEF